MAGFHVFSLFASSSNPLARFHQNCQIRHCLYFWTQVIKYELNTLFSSFIVNYKLCNRFSVAILLYLAPSEPQNLQLEVQGPTGKRKPKMNITWDKPANANGEIKKYTVVYSYNFGGKVIGVSHSTNSQTFTYSFDVLGGIRYTVSVEAETIQPGPKATSVEDIPVYSK